MSMLIQRLRQVNIYLIASEVKTNFRKMEPKIKGRTTIKSLSEEFTKEIQFLKNKVIFLEEKIN